MVLSIGLELPDKKKKSAHVVKTQIGYTGYIHPSIVPMEKPDKPFVKYIDATDNEQNAEIVAWLAEMIWQNFRRK